MLPNMPTSPAFFRGEKIGEVTILSRWQLLDSWVYLVHSETEGDFTTTQSRLLDYYDDLKGEHHANQRIDRREQLQ